MPQNYNIFFTTEPLAGTSCPSPTVTTLDESKSWTASCTCYEITPGESYTTETVDDVISLLVPDTVDAALARGTFSSGTMCRTSGGSIGSTGALSTSSIGISGTTSVVATISMTGLTPAAAYTITANINRYTAGGGGFVDTIQVEIDFTADAASDSVDYDVPVNTDYDYEFASIASVVAA